MFYIVFALMYGYIMHIDVYFSRYAFTMYILGRLVINLIWILLFYIFITPLSFVKNNLFIKIFIVNILISLMFSDEPNLRKYAVTSIDYYKELAPVALGFLFTSLVFSYLFITWGKRTINRL